jgi:hypothetical protein
MNPIALSPRLDLDDAESRLPLLEGDLDRPKIIRITPLALKGVES